MTDTPKTATVAVEPADVDAIEDASGRRMVGRRYEVKRPVVEKTVVRHYEIVRPVVKQVIREYQVVKPVLKEVVREYQVVRPVLKTAPAQSFKVKPWPVLNSHPSKPKTTDIK